MVAAPTMDDGPKEKMPVHEVFEHELLTLSLMVAVAKGCFLGGCFAISLCELPSTHFFRCTKSSLLVQAEDGTESLRKSLLFICRASCTLGFLLYT